MIKILFGLLIGSFAGILDVIPMVLQKLPLQADISAFCMWVVVGVLVATSNIKLNGPLKGIVIAFLVLSPTAVLIGWENPMNLVPVGIMTVVLGGLVGWGNKIEKG